MNPDTLESVYNEAKNSEGSANEELQKYLDSIEGRLAKFKTAVQEIAYNAIDSKMAKDVIDVGTGIVNMLNDVVVALGKISSFANGFGASGIIGLIGGAIYTKKSGGGLNKQFLLS